MKVEKTQWQPKGRGLHPKSETRIALETMKIGDCLRIVHDDVKCHHHTTDASGACGLSFIINKLRQEGYFIEWYHEDHGVAVVRRLKSRTNQRLSSCPGGNRG